MMNLVALSLIATSIVVSGLFSPNPQNNGEKQEQLIANEGHRSAVVEYTDHVSEGNTKVFISPEKGFDSGKMDEQLSRTAASVAGVAQEVLPGQDGPHFRRPRELICDAYGKCKHKIAGVWSKGKEKAAEAEDAVEEAVEEAKESAEGVRQNAKEKVREAGEATGRVKEKTGEATGRVKEKTGEATGRVKDKTGEAAKKVKEKTGEAAKKVKEKTGEAAKKVKEKTGEAAEKVEKRKGKTEEMVEETGEMIKEKSEKGRKELADIGKRGKEVIIWYICALGYFISKEAVNSMMSVTHLLGFATGYGISVWVTFIMSNVLAGVLGRQQFGMLQSKIYPVYFKMMVGSIGLALVGHLMGQKGRMFRNKADMFQGFNLMTSLLLVLGNLLFLEPRATKTMFNRMKLDKEEGRGRSHVSAPPTRNIDTVGDEATGPATTNTASTTEPTTTSTTAAGRAEEDEAKSKLGKLDNRLKKLNSYSSLLNIMTLMGLTWHLVYLSQRLRPSSC